MKKKYRCLSCDKIVRFWSTRTIVTSNNEIYCEDCYKTINIEENYGMSM